MVLSERTTEKIPSDNTGDRSRERPTSSAAQLCYCKRKTFVWFLCSTIVAFQDSEHERRTVNCTYTCILTSTLFYRSLVTYLAVTTDKDTLGNAGVTSAKPQKASVWMGTVWNCAVKQFVFSLSAWPLLPTHYGLTVEGCFATDRIQWHTHTHTQPHTQTQTHTHTRLGPSQRGISPSQRLLPDNI